MLLIFSSTDFVFCLLIVSFVFSFTNLSFHVLSSAYQILYLYFHHLQYWTYLLSIAFLIFFPPYEIFVFSSVYYPWIHSTIDVENLRASTQGIKLAFSQTCNRLERSFAWKIVSNILWMFDKLTDEAIDQFWKLETALLVEILAAAVPSEAIALHSS